MFGPAWLRFAFGGALMRHRNPDSQPKNQTTAK
jgi:hypothetical protein